MCVCGKVCGVPSTAVRRVASELNHRALHQCNVSNESGSFVLESHLRQLTVQSDAREAVQLSLGLRGCIAVSDLPGLHLKV